MKKRFFILVSCILTACTPKMQRYTGTVFTMGSVSTITIYSDKKAEEAQSLLQHCKERIEALDRLFDMHDQDSALSRINRGAGCTVPYADPSVRKLLQAAFFFADKTAGAFNPVLGSVTSLWNIGFEQAAIPDTDTLRTALTCTDYTAVSYTEESITLPKAGMQLDLGAIAKGFAADDIAIRLRTAGVQHGLINIGGTLCAVGTRQDGSPWNIGIRDPAGDRNEVVLYVPVSDTAISTSGDYERFFEQDGKRYHHIFNPVTGFPVENNLRSVSIFTDSATAADALSTACFVLGYEKSLQLLAAFPNTDAIFIFDDCTIKTTPSFEQKIRLSSLKYVIASGERE